jgi:hypothetical protein
MVSTDPFQRQYRAIAEWNWQRIERAVANQGLAHLRRVGDQDLVSFTPAPLSPEDDRRSQPAELAPEDIRVAVRHDVSTEVTGPLSSEAVERELYFAAALHAHCQERGLQMGAARGPDGSLWICARKQTR